MKAKLKQMLATNLALIFVLCALTGCSASPQKAILGKWYNDDGDCLEILSDNTYSINQVSDYSYEIGLDSGKWEYLKEESFFKFYADNYDGDIIKIEIREDAKGTYINYASYGIFYKE